MRYQLFAHASLKIASVALAVLLWFMVSSQQAAVERGLRIPLELQNLPTNLEMVEPPQETVDVRVRGAADLLGRLTSGDLVATVDLSAAQPGRRLFHMSTERVKAPFAVEVTQVSPSSIAIRFEPSATRVVRVQPTVEGEPAQGFIVGAITADPKVVEVVGPESALRRVEEVITEPLWVGSATAAVKSTVILGVAEQGVRVKTARSAVVSVAIVPAPETRMVDNVPVRARNLATGLLAKITPQTVTVRVRGTKDVVEKIKGAAIMAYVDLRGISEGEYGLPVRLEQTRDIGVDQLDPTMVSVHVQ
ncbi:MAG: CdaR family protein [Vicinamibacterales bacterium]|nr:CdaR family protein [Vicinamibacterales bacterium]